MNKDMCEILEICLNELESGALLYELLERYPEYASELRPILETSLEAQTLAVPGPSTEVFQRNRVRVMRQLAQMREETPSPFAWFLPMRRAVVAFALGLLIFVSGTNLVRASSGAVPGDGLYPVKRSWEKALLFFAIDPQVKNDIRVELEKERLEELHELFFDSRSATVDFAGRVSRQNGDGWRVANVLVIITPDTILPDRLVNDGDVVRVSGFTRGDGLVLATAIELLPTNTIVFEEAEGLEKLEEQPVSTPAITPHVTEPVAPEHEANINPTAAPNPPVIFAPKIETLMGVLKSIKGNMWKVNDVTINVADAVIEGVPSIGAQVKVKGYYQSNGIFVVAKIVIVNSDNHSDNKNNNPDNNSNGNSNDNFNTNENHNDNLNVNTNENHNDNQNDNQNDSDH